MKIKIIINVKEKEKSIEAVEAFRKKKYEGKDIRFTNVNMTNLNKLVNKQLFAKNDLFIDSKTLWEMMQDVGGEGAHHFHGLTAQDIIEALDSMTEPYAIIEVEHERHAIITTALSHFDEQTMIVIKVGSRTHINIKANINKIVTMYPKRDIDKVIQKTNPKDVLYKK